MNDSSHGPGRDGGPSPGLERRVTLARLSLAWEQVWPRLAPAFGIAALFAILALFDLPRQLGGYGHAALLVLFALAFAAALIWAVVKVQWPSRQQARRRLEQSNALAHRPLTALQDRLPPDLADGPEAAALWAAHRRRVAAGLAGIRPPLPQAGWARIDPWALRAALGLLLVVAVGFAGWRAPYRLEAAFLPSFPVVESAWPQIEGWITPPTHTRAPPLFLTREGVPVLGAEGMLALPAPEGASPPPPAIEVPAGSDLTLRVNLAPGPAVLELGGRSIPFEQADPDNQLVEAPVEEGDRILVRSGDETLAAWQIAIRPDLPPEVAFGEPPAATARNSVQIHYAAQDDYGLAAVTARIVPADDPGQMLELDLQLPGLRPAQASEVTYHDLTAHPWAGRAVQVTLLAEDEAGQRGRSETLDFVLPRRQFIHPVAQALIEQRGALGLGIPDLDRAELALSSIATVPQTFNRDSVVSLSLAVAAARLRHDTGPAAVESVQHLLWDTALRLEDGDVSLAERALRSAQQRLMEALARNAGDAEIERLMRELREAMDKYMQAMLEQALRNLSELSEIPEDAQGGEMMGEEELRRMLDEVEDLARGGARDAARDLLSELNRLLESLKEGRLMADPQGGGPGQRSLEELSEILRDQQRLLDRSYRQTQPERVRPGRPGQEQGRQGQGQQGQGQQGQGQQGQGQQGQQGQGRQGLSGDALDQEDLRRRLGRLLEELAEGGMGVPEAFGRADESMGQARDSLREGSPGAATEQQSHALDQLRQGMRGLMDQLAEQMEPGGTGAGEQQGRGGRDRRDPLGRPMPGDWEDGSSTRVPDQADLQRAREILEELYRRSGERFRAPEELDYIDRLLRRF